MPRETIGELTFDFQQVNRSRQGLGSVFPEGIIRIGNKTLTMSNDLVNRFGGTTYRRKSGDKSFKAMIYFDAIGRKAIKLVPDAMGIAFEFSEGAVAKANIPADMLRQGLPVGDYVLVPYQHGMIFILAE